MPTIKTCIELVNGHISIGKHCTTWAMHGNKLLGKVFLSNSSWEIIYKKICSQGKWTQWDGNYKLIFEFEILKQRK